VAVVKDRTALGTSGWLFPFAAGAIWIADAFRVHAIAAWLMVVVAAIFPASHSVVSRACLNEICMINPNKDDPGASLIEVKIVSCRRKPVAA
jgi:hypothetical protein